MGFLRKWCSKKKFHSGLFTAEVDDTISAGSFLEKKFRKILTTLPKGYLTSCKKIQFCEKLKIENKSHMYVSKAFLFTRF